MYVDKVFVYLVLGMMLLMLFRMWRNEIRLSKVEKFMTLMGQHGIDVDRTVKALIEIIDKLFKGLKEGIEKNKERENGRREEGNSEGQSQ